MELYTKWRRGGYIRDTHRGSLICTCLIHSAGLKNSIIHPIHYSSPLHYQSAQRNKINPARNNSLWRDFFSTKHLAGWLQACTQAQIRLYEHTIRSSLLNIIILSKKIWLQCREIEEQTGETREEERKERIVRGNDHSQHEEIKDKEQEKKGGA